MFLPSSGSLTCWIFASAYPSGASASRTCCTLAVRSSGVVMRVPDSKSMPKLMPRPAIAIAPMARIAPEVEKNHFDLPMKSNFQPLRCLPTPSALGRAQYAACAPSMPRIAEVASTAVNSETIVPIPRVKAKPLTPAVASVNRMNATPIVTTFASMIVLSAFE